MRIWVPGEHWLFGAKCGLVIRNLFAAAAFSRSYAFGYAPDVQGVRPPLDEWVLLAVGVLAGLTSLLVAGAHSGGRAGLHLAGLHLARFHYLARFHFGIGGARSDVAFARPAGSRLRLWRCHSVCARQGACR